MRRLPHNSRCRRGNISATLSITRLTAPAVRVNREMLAQIVGLLRELGGQIEASWAPDYLDYVFLAFNTSTAFSPTDTMVLARRAKVLMMWQSIVSLTTIAVLAARAINTL